MEKSELMRNYQKACNDYLHAFCDKHSFDFEEAKECWVSDIPGTITQCGDFFVSMETIITDIEQNVPENMFIKWYDYCMICPENSLNYKTWLKLDDEEDADIKFKNKNVVNLNNMLEKIKELEKLAIEYKNKD